MPALPSSKNSYHVNQIIFLNYDPYEYEYFSKRTSYALTCQSYKSGNILNIKAPITTAEDDIQKKFFHCFSENIRLDNSAMAQKVAVSREFEDRLYHAATGKLSLSFQQ